MCSYFMAKIVISTLLISLFIVPNLSHAKSSKKVTDNNLEGKDDDGISGHIRGKRDLISYSDEEMTSTSETSDMDVEEMTTTKSCFGYADDVETKTVSFSTTTDSDKFKDGQNPTSLQSSIQILQSTLQNLMSIFQRPPEVTTTETSYKSSFVIPVPNRISTLDFAEFKDGGSSNEFRSGLKRLLDFMERQGYNPYEIPKRNSTNTVWYDPGDNETDPVYVTIYLNIRSVSNIDEINGQVSLDIDLTTHWVDGKLNEWYTNNNITLLEEYWQTWPEADNPVGVQLDSKILNNFWAPDISIEKLAKASTSKILSRSERLKFRYSGRFNYVKRMTVKVNCEMDFTYYPADTQKCDFKLRSYSFNASDLELLWRQPEGVYLMETGDPNFDLQVVDVMRYSVSTTGKRHCRDASEDQASCSGYDLDPEETFDVLRFTLHMRRKISYQLLQTYIPSALYIAITWLCFMIPPKMVEGRIAIAMTTLLTLTAMFSSVRENTPIVSYIKAIDIWMAAGIVFIFLVLLEFTVLLWTEAGKTSKEELETKEDETDPSSEMAAGNRNRSVLPAQSDSTWVRDRKWLRSKATMVIRAMEYYSFELILLITMSFNIAYWTWLFVASGYFGWRLDDWHNANGGANKYEDKMGGQLHCPVCHNK